MKKIINNYIKETDTKLDNIIKQDLNKLKKEHLIRIGFIEHERLVNLIITLFFSLFTVILVIILLGCIINYFFYDNILKKLYKQYEKMI